MIVFFVFFVLLCVQWVQSTRFDCVFVCVRPGAPATGPLNCSVFNITMKSQIKCQVNFSLPQYFGGHTHTHTSIFSLSHSLSFECNTLYSNWEMKKETIRGYRNRFKSYRFHSFALEISLLILLFCFDSIRFGFISHYKMSLCLFAQRVFIAYLVCCYCLPIIFWLSVHF